ncbi:MAG: TlpA family protein disulfide reductase [Firmicutes bacterium]|nr:TlpA family protein disulfide reductase [Bacillota bacterium]HOB22175.1 TlpA disulfide reductase family protein [Bacillota bacterium]
MNKGKYTFPVLLDKNGKVAQRYQVQGLPTTFFIDNKGVIKDVKVGALSASQLKEKIKLIR